MFSLPFLVLCVITFLAAFLLFQIELIVAKLFLPNYGGSYLVWGACVVFFQAVLLLGYLFAHRMIISKGIGRYLKIHLILLLLPFLFFPGRPIHITPGTSHLPLVIDIFLRLLMTIGPVFFILSTISLVTQSWVSSSTLEARRHPYRLYAISNAGSFAALLTYPFVFEYLLSNTQQLDIWRCLYLLLVVLNILAFKLIPLQEKAVSGPPIKTFPPGLRPDRAGGGGDNGIDRATAWRWFFLSAAGVVLFLSVTNMMTYEVAPVPLLWIIPLAIYLLAFVLNFKQRPWCPSWIRNGIAAIIGLAVGLYFLTKIPFFPPLIAILILNAFLFILCMFTQNALIRLKPHDSNLTFFYVMISLGGFAGGILTSWVIPLISNNLVEFLAGLLLLALAMEERPAKQPLSMRGRIIISVAMISLMAVLLVAWPQQFYLYSLKGLLLLALGMSMPFLFLSRIRTAFLAALALIIIVSSPLESSWRHHPSLAKKRNYYGIYDVYDTSAGLRTMVHGTTLHGVQMVKENMRMIPIGYYSPISPIGEVLIKDIFQAHRVGVVGLGAGTMAMYSKPSAPIDYYELDPDVVELAQKHFWYLGLAPGPVACILGDARVSLEKNKTVMYDVLVVDAFGGDSIPIHLVNKDVVAKYRAHLTDGGGVLFHISNRYLDLQPVLAHIAGALGGFAGVKDTPDGGVNMHSTWVFITWDPQRFVQLVVREGWLPLNAEKYKGIRVWTDNYSSILPILKLDVLWNEFKYFKFMKW